MNMEDMKDAPALSIMAPWPWLILYAGKDMENRYYPPTYKNQDYRGPIFLHCGRNPDPNCWHASGRSFVAPRIRATLPADFEERATRESRMGGIVGVAEIVDVVRYSESPWYARGQHGWVLRNAQPLPFMPYNGQPKLFPVLFDLVMKHMGSHCWCCGLLESPDPEEPQTKICECPIPGGKCKDCFKCDKHCMCEIPIGADEIDPIGTNFDLGRMIVCRRSGPGKGCAMTWAKGDKVTASIPWAGDVAGIVRDVRMEGLSQKVQLRTAVYAPLMSKYIVSEDKRWFGAESLKTRATVIPELGESDLA